MSRSQPEIDRCGVQSRLRPWDAERSLGIDEARLLASAAFGIPCDRCRVLGEGWDFINFLADETWVLRFPKRAECDQALVREREILERLHRLDLPVPVPRFEHFSDARERFPWHFAGYHLLPGTPLSHVGSESLRESVAAELGRFLAALHGARIETELPSPWISEEQRTWVRREFESAVRAYPADIRRRVERYLDAPDVPEPAVPQVLAHADLGGEHILVDVSSGRLTGIIDWADSCRMVRSVDFAGLYYEGGRELAASAYARYGLLPDEQEWRWLECTSIAIGIGQVFYGYHGHQPEITTRALERLRTATLRS